MSAFARPTAVIVAHNELTEITDFLVPLALLSAGGFDVVTASKSEGPVHFWPNLVAEADATLATVASVLDSRPDLIVVPFVEPHDDPTLIGWLQQQAANGAVVASICDGAFVTASAGLLDGRRATAHFYSLGKRRRTFPNVDWVENVRYVDAGSVFSTAGISASAPASVHLVAKYIGQRSAERTAARYGIADYSPAHDSERFNFGLGEATTYVWNNIRGLQKTAYTLVLRDGVDEYSLAFVLDLLMRTSRASITTVAESESVTTAHGLTLIPDRSHVADGAGWRIELPALRDGVWHAEADAGLTIDSPAIAIETVLQHIAAEYGDNTVHLVTTQLEFVP